MSSAIAGGASVLIGSLAYAFVAREAKVRAVSGKQVFARHVFAELAKLASTLGLVSIAYASGWFVAGWLLAAMGCALCGHFLALLFIK